MTLGQRVFYKYGEWEVGCEDGSASKLEAGQCLQLTLTSCLFISTLLQSDHYLKPISTYLIFRPLFDRFPLSFALSSTQIYLLSSLTKLWNRWWKPLKSEPRSSMVPLRCWKVAQTILSWRTFDIKIYLGLTFNLNTVALCVPNHASSCNNKPAF